MLGFLTHHRLRRALYLKLDISGKGAFQWNLPGFLTAREPGHQRVPQESMSRTISLMLNPFSAPQCTASFQGDEEMTRNQDAPRQPDNCALNTGAVSDILLDMSLALISGATRCRCVAVRVEKDGDFPLVRCQGFTNKFIEEERSLLPRDAKADLSPEQRLACLECLCGKVIRGQRTECEKVFTSKGSLWLDDLSGRSKIPAKVRNEMRKACFEEGFRSFALVPCHPDGQTLALLHVSDTRRGLLSDALVAGLEESAGHFAQLLAQLRRLRAVETRPHQLEEKKLRILVVDDEAEMASLVAEMLEGKGHQVVTAPGGPEALTILKETKFDLVITDFNMPLMSGLELAEEIWTHWHPFAPPLILMSGTSSEEIALQEKRPPDVAAFLTKPFSPQYLMETVQAVVE
jgi:CheY-like chemotaxis protein